MVKLDTDRGSCRFSCYLAGLAQSEASLRILPGTELMLKLTGAREAAAQWKQIFFSERKIKVNFYVCLTRGFRAVLSCRLFE